MRRAALAQEMKEFDAFVQPPFNHLRAADHLTDDGSNLFGAEIEAAVELLDRDEYFAVAQMRIMQRRDLHPVFIDELGMAIVEPAVLHRLIEHAETMCASRFRLTVTSQRVVGPHAIATAAPFDAAAAKARNKYDKRQDIANGTKPELTLRDIPTIAQLEQAMQLGLQSETAGQRRRDDHRGWGEPAEQEADQGKRHGKGNGEAGKTERIHGADGPCPANVVQQQFAQGLLGADMGDDERRNCDLQSRAPRS